MSYTLILTLAIVRYSAGGVAIEHVPGFATEADCLVAGNAWLQQANKAANTARNNLVSAELSAVCVKSGGK